ncbi:PDZ domain-containing protein [Candidatus Dojkabacteria bacterium]|uniref:PDZ domain-containing protein n=1 Tax=Candidatus Dojkabacteria bacterium TaxID=2099670 RepID=A0A3M0YXV4_9BACT|nr:MAG: PDZ domain-containing protein [Candidatus Dojkabacteria bacterium]
MAKLKTFLFLFFIILVLTVTPVLGFIGAFVGYRIASNSSEQIAGGVIRKPIQVVEQESALIRVSEKANKAVVSVIITKELPKYEEFWSSPLGDDPFWDFFGFRIPQRRKIGTEERQVGAGTGFLVSSDGMIVTNRHVVEDESASYTVIFNDKTKKEAKVIARDTILDIAFLKIDGNNYEFLPLGSSDNLKLGQTAIAVGNALGEFSNTVTVGVISGLQRDIVAMNASRTQSERLTGLIQTDAGINQGNSGGPLLDIDGNVIGVNVAVAGNAENIGFAIPSSLVIDLLERLKKDGTIERPRLGVRFIPINKEVARLNNLSVDYGALIQRGQNKNEIAVIPGSPADKAGLMENDIILEINGQKIDNEKNTLPRLIQNLRFGDIIDVKYLSKGQEKNVKIKLERFRGG